MELVVVGMTVVVGLFAGSLVTMLVARIPSGIPLTPVSRCPMCGHHLSLPESLPVVSWLLCRGRCRHCGAIIPWSVVVLELATAALCVLVVVRTDPGGWLIVPPLILAVSLVALVVIDLVHYRLPDLIVVPAILGSLVVMEVLALTGLVRPSAVLIALAAGSGFFVFLLVAHLLNPASLGFGDVKLALLLGIHTGWVGVSRFGSWNAAWRLTFWAVVLGLGLGLFFALALWAARRVSGRHLLPDPVAGGIGPVPFLSMSVPFGPGLAVGTLLVVCFPETVMG